MLYLLTLSQAPIVVLFSYIYLRDYPNREPLTLLFKAFFAGAFSVLPILIFEELLSYLPGMGMMSPAFVAAGGLIEEFFKLWALKVSVYRHSEFDEPYDGIMYAVAVSLGFAAIENLFYVLPLGMEVGISRMFTAVPMHAMTGVLMGFYVGQAKFCKDPALEKKLFFVAWAVASTAHGFYNYFLTVSAEALSYLALLLLLLQIRLAHKAVAIHRSRKLGAAVELQKSDSSEIALLVPDRLKWATISVLLLIGLALLELTDPLELGFALDDPKLNLTVWFLLALGLAVLSGLYRYKDWAWKIAFVVFVLTLPTPVFALGLAGLYGLLHPSSREKFKIV